MEKSRLEALDHGLRRRVGAEREDRDRLRAGLRAQALQELEGADARQCALGRIADGGSSIAATMDRRRATASLAALACGAFAAPAPAQLGGKVIHIVVPFAAGGAREVLARSFYSELGAALGQPVIVENRPGAGGAIGTASVAKAAPDGNTLVFAASSHHITALLAERPPYDPIKDSAAVANIGMQSYVLMTSAALPARKVSELVAYA